jgi:hypothetical protein|tara:strand:- start:240 stop:665 length:426 start_codon:yes stop_codon:yes gene_type:complete
MKYLLLVFSLAFASHAWGGDNNIIGKWQGQNTKDGVMIFYENGKLDLLSKDGKPAFSGKSAPTITWEAIIEVIPHQLYINMSHKDRRERIPLGIYKIVKNKLILREPITYHRTMGGFDMGVSRYEIPKDFSGILKVFKRAK